MPLKTVCVKSYALLKRTEDGLIWDFVRYSSVSVFCTPCGWQEFEGYVECLKSIPMVFDGDDCDFSDSEDNSGRVQCV